MSRIIISHNRPDLGTCYAVIWPQRAGVAVIYGNRDPAGMFHVPDMNQAEFLTYCDHPDLAALHDGFGWNLDALHTFLDNGR